jgi:hypothetical protein
MLAIANAVLSL